MTIRHQVTRLRHEVRRRTLRVDRKEQLTPGMLRLHLRSDELDDFVSASFDDHVKLFLPTDESAPDGARPPMRDFTPRRFDTAAGTLVIDVAMHAGGPAMAWAEASAAGDTLQIGGPRGSTVVPDDFDWYVLVGDASALPAIGRRLEELRADVPVTTIVLVDSDADAQRIDTRADWTAAWPVRTPAGDIADLRDVLAGFTPPPGDGFVWIAGEAEWARAARAMVIDDLGHPREWVKASGYWQRGDPGAHVRIED